MHRALLIIIALLLAIGLTSCSQPEAAVRVGTVKIVSDGIEYIPLQNFVFSQRKDGLAADGARIKPGERDGEVPVVPYHDDMRIMIE